MKPPPFEYLAPRSREEAIGLLAEHADDAKLLAGGQSLIPLLNFRLTRPGLLIDLNRVEGLDAAGYDPDAEELVFGPMVRQSDVERSPLALEHCPLLVEAVKHIGHRAIRNRGTVGGSLAHADPAAELPLVLVALEGRVKLASERGERWVKASEFFLSYLTTALEPDEMLVEVRIPRLQSGRSGWAFEEFSRRHGDFAMAAAATILRFDAGRRIESASIAIAGGGPTPIRADAAERALAGRPPDPVLLAEIGAAASEACETESDLHASAEYRRALIASLVERALIQASQTQAGP